MHATAPVAVFTWLSCDRNKAGPRNPICTPTCHLHAADTTTDSRSKVHRCKACRGRTKHGPTRTAPFLADIFENAAGEGRAAHRLHDLADTRHGHALVDERVCQPSADIGKHRHGDPWQHAEDAGLQQVHAQMLLVVHGHPR